MNSFVQNLMWINAGIAVLIIMLILLRSIFKSKIHTRVICILWTLVFLRMLFPLPIESDFSIINNNTFLSSFSSSTTQINSTSEANGTAAVNSQIEVADTANSQTTDIPVSSAHATTDGMMIIYIAGAVVVLSYILLSNMRFRKRIKLNEVSAKILDADKKVFEQQSIQPLPLYVVKGLTSPCLYGLIKPKILLNEKSVENDIVRQYTIYHETTHYKHWDNIIFLGTVTACIISWFNPFMWLALYLSKKDRELYCDESVVKKLGDENAIDYGKSLLYLVQNNSKGLLTISTTMTGSKRELKNRIKNIARNKKSWIILSATIVLILAGIFILIGTQQPDKDNSTVIIGGADGPTYIGAYSNMIDITGVSIYKNLGLEEKMLLSIDQEDRDVLDEFWGIYASSEFCNDTLVNAYPPMTAKVEYIFNGAQETMLLNYGDSDDYITITFDEHEQRSFIKNQALEDFLIKLVADRIPFVPLDKESTIIEVSDSTHAPMNDFMERLPAAFYEIPHSTQASKPLNDLFPAKEIPAEELSWFLAGRDDITVQACKGIRFANHDILIVYFYNSELPYEAVSEDIQVNIDMYGESLIPPQTGYTGASHQDDGFGFWTYSFYGNRMSGIIAEVASEVMHH